MRNNKKQKPVKAKANIKPKVINIQNDPTGLISKYRSALLLCAGLSIVLLSYKIFQAYNSLGQLRSDLMMQAKINVPNYTPTPAENAVNQSIYDVSLDTNTWSQFNSPRLGFSFQYPHEWGGVVEEVNDAVIVKKGTSGKTYGLIFSNIDYTQLVVEYPVFGSGLSADYSGEDKEANISDYSGNSNLPQGVYGTILARPFSCNTGSKKYEYYGRIDFNLPGREISGVRLIMPLSAQKQKPDSCPGEYSEHNAMDFIVKPETAKDKNINATRLAIYKLILVSAKVLVKPTL